MMINAAWIAWLSPGKSKLKKPLASMIAGQAGPATSGDGAPSSLSLLSGPAATATVQGEDEVSISPDPEDSDSVPDVDAAKTSRSVKLRSRRSKAGRKVKKHNDT
jgi:hypothetical protein